MTSKTDRKNMFSVHDENDVIVYSDNDGYDSDCNGDYNGDYDQEWVNADSDNDDGHYELPMSDKYIQEDAQNRLDEEEKSNMARLQDANTMAFIRPARSMPTVAEMNAEWDTAIALERKAKLNEFGKFLLVGWKKLAAVAKENHKYFLLKQSRLETLHQLKKIIRPFIQTLELPIISVDDECKRAALKRKLMTSILDCFKSKQSRVNCKTSLENLRKTSGKINWLRTQKRNNGMNRHSDWHVARKAGGLALAGTETEAERVDRLKRKAAIKSRKADEKVKFTAACALAQSAQTEIKVVKMISIPEIVSDISEEQQAVEDAELAADLARINRICVEKISSIEKAEAEAAAEKKDLARIAAEEKAELDRFVKVLGKNTHKGKRFLNITSTSLIAQKRVERCAQDAKYAKRTEAFAELGDKTKLEEVLKCTQMCSSVATGKKCPHGTKCRFAHTLDELQRKECRFGLSCRFVKQENGVFKNAKFGRTGKSCSCVHPGESDSNFASRLGIKQPKPTVPKFTPVILSVPKLSAPKTAGCWSAVVSKAEVKTVVADAKAKMCKPWAEIVITSLTEEEKNKVYGKGAEIAALLGFVDGTGLGKSNNGRLEPIAHEPSTIRKPWDKRGLGFYEPQQATTSKVLISGFNWVKGAVLAPEPVQPTKTPIDLIMEKVYAAVVEINKRVIERTVAKINAELQTKMQMVC